MNTKQSKNEVLDCYLSLLDAGLIAGTSGNVSVRFENGMIITPSGQDAKLLKPEDMVRVIDGKWSESEVPSSEWLMHQDLYLKRKDVQAIVHTHSIHATALACLGKGLPAFHYMVATVKGHDIPCAPYQTFGTKELSESLTHSIGSRYACLLENHGLLCAGKDLDHARRLAGEVEHLCQIYFTAKQLGEPTILSPLVMQDIGKRLGVG